MEKILIIKLGALGDIIFAEGAIRDIRAYHPNAEITLLTAPFFTRLLRNHPCIDHFITDLRRPRWQLAYLISLLFTLRRHKFDRVYDLQNNRRTNLYHKLMLPIIWSGKARFSTFRYQQDHTQPTSRCQQFKAQLSIANVPTAHCMQPDWSWLRDPADTLLAQYKLNPGFILLLPGCSNRHPEKRWPGFAELSSKLLAKGFSVVIAPGPDEMDLLHTIPGTWVLDQGNPLSIPKLLGLAQHAALVIGNDSGPTHLLACSHTRGIALFHKKRYVHDTNIEQAYTVFCAHPIAKISTEQVYQTTCQQLSLAHQKPKHSAV